MAKRNGLAGYDGAAWAFTFLRRPSLRAFATWAHWSDAFRRQIATATDPDAVRGTAVGVQMETWW